jgi:serine/threonine-protein kinase
MSKTGQGRPDTQSYDRPMALDRATEAEPAPRHLPTAVMPVELGESSAVDAPSMDPAAAGPVPQALLSLTPHAKDPVVDKAPGAFRAGDVVDHFEIVGVVGQGGMGCVYKAFDRELGRTVAIKTLHGIDKQSPQALARFRREAQAASRVVHPNLVIIYSSGTHDDTPYIAMEYLSGRNLAAEIAEGPIGIERTADIVGAACAGVYAAHRAEVVHRDLKPANIFLAKTPMGETPKILDFGISRIGDDNSSLTGTGDIIGTTYYLAPEQAGGRQVDARVDQYALGVILYECLTGARPFTGSAVFEIMRNIMEGTFEPPSRLRPIPHELETVVVRAMSRMPDDRFPRVRELGLALVPFMSTMGRQLWGHHFMAPEAEMPVGHSLAVPVGPGVPGRPAVAPVQQAPTKIIPDAEQAPTRTLPEGEGPDTALMSAQPWPIRHSKVVALVAIGVALLAVGIVLVLKRPAARPTARPAVTEMPTTVVMPAPAQPAATVSPPMPSPPAMQAAEPTEGRGRDPHKKSVARPGKAKEANEPEEIAPTNGTQESAQPLKHGMW